MDSVNNVVGNTLSELAALKLCWISNYELLFAMLDKLQSSHLIREQHQEEISQQLKGENTIDTEVVVEFAKGYFSWM